VEKQRGNRSSHVHLHRNGLLLDRSSPATGLTQLVGELGTDPNRFITPNLLAVEIQIVKCPDNNRRSFEERFLRKGQSPLEHSMIYLVRGQSDESPRGEIEVRHIPLHMRVVFEVAVQTSAVHYSCPLSVRVHHGPKPHHRVFLQERKRRL
jgi:hypothetical protein